MGNDPTRKSDYRSRVHQIIGGLLLIAVPCFLFLPSLRKPADVAERSSCRYNLKEIGIVFVAYAEKHVGTLPRLSKTPGQLMFPADSVYPDFLTDTRFLLCPDHPSHDTLIEQSADDPKSLIDDHSYYYLSHSTVNEEEGMAFVEAYREKVFNGESLPDEIVSADGVAIPRATDRGDEDLSEILRTITPILVEKPHHHESKGVRGGHVLYQDGHVEYIRIGEKYPMTESFIAALESIDR